MGGREALFFALPRQRSPRLLSPTTTFVMWKGKREKKTGREEGKETRFSRGKEERKRRKRRLG